MTKKKTIRSIDALASELRDVSPEEQRAVAGGASAFLRGALIEAGSNSSRFQPSNSFAAKSQTTLECWHECTVNISGC